MNTQHCFEFARSGSCRFGMGCRFIHISPSPTGPISNSQRGRKKTNPGKGGTGPIDEFFAKYPGFVHDRTRPVWSEFRCLCDHYGWKNKDSTQRAAKREFKDAMIAEFGTIYGTDSEALEPWRKLCDAIRITPVPDNVKECRQVRIR